MNPKHLGNVPSDAPGKFICGIWNLGWNYRHFLLLLFVEHHTIWLIFLHHFISLDLEVPGDLCSVILNHLNLSYFLSLRLPAHTQMFLSLPASWLCRSMFTFPARSLHPSQSGQFQPINVLWAIYQRLPPSVKLRCQLIPGGHLPHKIPDFCYITMVSDFDYTHITILKRFKSTFLHNVTQNWFSGAFCRLLDIIIFSRLTACRPPEQSPKPIFC